MCWLRPGDDVTLGRVPATIARPAIPEKPRP
jgi:hypothetical protein